MKQILTQGILALTLLVGTTACQKDALRGEGNTVTETRAVAAFNAVEISGNRQVEIIKSNESKVEITGYQNLVAAYSAHVSNGRLRFEFPDHTRVRNDNIRLKIYTPSLSSMVLSGNNTVQVSNGFIGTSMECRLSGSGEVNFSGGLFTNLAINISGSGTVNAQAATATHGRVDISGNATIEVRATETLRVAISGDGEVYYHGNPVLTQQISGRGRIVKR
ncbi:MAG: DUF2807 domain-containing protein [Chitinophagaceae bacterium]|nr:DUF2807 domain-containing protein [Chitinophagaceae bacterium]